MLESVKASLLAVIVLSILGFNSNVWAQSPENILFEAPLRIDGQQPIIEALINNKPARLVYDSGASGMTLFAESFPDLFEDSEGAGITRAFGGDGTAETSHISQVTFKASDNELIIERPKLVSFSGIGGGEPPFIEGLVPPIQAVSKNGRGVLVIDPHKDKLTHYKPRVKLNFKRPIRLGLEEKFGWQWRVKLPVKFADKAEPVILNLVFDTGMGDSLLLNQSKLKDVQSDNTGYNTAARGLAGESEQAYAGRVQVPLGGDNIWINASLTEELPFANDADGFIGWKFLKRFKTALDMDEKQLIIELEGADMSDDSPRKAVFRAAGVPLPDWKGMKILRVGSWGTVGLREGDILTSVDGIRLSSTQMYSVLSEQTKDTNICWRPQGEAMERCAIVQDKNIQ